MSHFASNAPLLTKLHTCIGGPLLKEQQNMDLSNVVFIEDNTKKKRNKTRKKGKKTPKKEDKSFGKGGQWSLVPPKNGEPRTRAKNGRVYHYCHHCKFWALHQPGKGKKCKSQNAVEDLKRAFGDQNQPFQSSTWFPGEQLCTNTVFGRPSPVETSTLDGKWKPLASVPSEPCPFGIRGNTSFPSSVGNESPTFGASVSTTWLRSAAGTKASFGNVREKKLLSGEAAGGPFLLATARGGPGNSAIAVGLASQDSFRFDSPNSLTGTPVTRNSAMTPDKSSAPSLGSSIRASRPNVFASTATAIESAGANKPSASNRSPAFTFKNSPSAAGPRMVTPKGIGMRSAMDSCSSSSEKSNVFNYSGSFGVPGSSVFASAASNESHAFDFRDSFSASASGCFAPSGTATKPRQSNSSFGWVASAATTHKGNSSPGQPSSKPPGDAAAAIRFGGPNRTQKTDRPVQARSPWVVQESVMKTADGVKAPQPFPWQPCSGPTATTTVPCPNMPPPQPRQPDHVPSYPFDRWPSNPAASTSATMPMQTEPAAFPRRAMLSIQLNALENKRREMEKYLRR